MNVLGIETSCDETAAAVVRNGRDVLSNVVFSQISLHEPYGGVVPEIATRSHVENLPRVIETALSEAGTGWNSVDAVAVTYGPGLAPSLLIGLSAAKALALRLDIPLVGINHLEAHIYSIFLGPDAPAPSGVCPFVALVVSGGHTCLVRVAAIGRYEVVGETMDDAAGEAFDKAANLLKLGYPGGPAIERTAASGNPLKVRFPRSRHKVRHSRAHGMNPDLCFSFSGLKTALLYHLRAHPDSPAADLAASYQEAIVDALTERTEKACAGEKVLAAVGGVSLNNRLRSKLASLAASLGIRLILAERRFCADNAAMVAGLAGAEGGVRGDAALALDVCPSLAIGECG
jgi:N6-L-threonylcarbamoyladenine synthase